MGSKYIVTKVDGTPVDDAVVIRRQDIFAPPALDAYANAIQCVIELSKGSSVNGASIKGLQDVADYFHDEAAKSWAEQRKLPD
jgi:hypothetical protein